MKKIFSIVLIGVLIVGLTGCGSKKGDSRFDYIIDQLNKASDDAVERYERIISFSDIEDRLTQNISSARLIACGDKEFTNDVDLTKTSYQLRLDGYNGEIVYNTAQFTGENNDNINYCLVFATNARGYLNIKVDFEKAKDKIYKPVFSIPELLSKDK